MFLKPHPNLHLCLIEFESDIIDEVGDEDCNLDIFEMVVNISKLMKELTNGVLNVQVISSGYQRHQMTFSMVGET
jgi:hypothetical protein